MLLHGIILETKIFINMQDEALVSQETETTEISKLAQIAEQFNEGTKAQPEEISEVEIDDATLLANLEERRAKGTFPIHHYTSQKLDRLSKFLKTKAKFKGIQEAYFIIALQLELAKLLGGDAALKQHERTQEKIYELPASLIEVIVYFLNKHEGSSLSSADDFLQIAMPINNALANVQAADSKIKELKVKIGIESPIAQ